MVLKLSWNRITPLCTYWIGKQVLIVQQGVKYFVQTMGVTQWFQIWYKELRFLLSKRKAFQMLLKATAIYFLYRNHIWLSAGTYNTKVVFVLRFWSLEMVMWFLRFWSLISKHLRLVCAQILILVLKLSWNWKTPFCIRWHWLTSLSCALRY